MTQFKTIERPASVSAGIKAYRAQCATIKGEAEWNFRGCHIVGRGVEIIALDETGERNDDLGGPPALANARPGRIPIEGPCFLFPDSGTPARRMNRT